MEDCKRSTHGSDRLSSALRRNYVGGVECEERKIAPLNIVGIVRALSVKPAKLLEPIS